MLYTVKEIAQLASVTVKTLHHYHKIGLLLPCKISEAGYRLYGQKELERLQQILFYRELDFPLKDIRKAMLDKTDRINVLTEQRKLLTARMRRLECLVKTLDDSIDYTMRGEKMDKNNMFKGLNEKEWKEALSEQAGYIKGKYGYDMLNENEIKTDQLNEMAKEAARFQNTLAQALRDGKSHKDESVRALLLAHMDFLNQHGCSLNPGKLLEQASFLIEDDFHRKMLEAMQVGLSYYYLAAVKAIQ